MKRVIRIILIILLIVLIIIQFIRPEKNKSTGISANDITTKYTVPENVHKILETSCYDCHSNNTIYPWYAEIQPVAWWLNNHIKDGKRSLNFSEFTRYPIRRQYKTMDEISDEVKKGGMPLSSYTFIHRYAKLNDDQKLLIYAWTAGIMDQIKASYPPDSLLLKR